MKAIVVRQPWATLIALGVKTIETRPAPPNGPMRPDGVRGLPGCTLERGERIAIVAGKNKADVTQTGWAPWEPLLDPDRLRHPRPLGAVACTVVVADALPILPFAEDGSGGPDLTVNPKGWPYPTLVRWSGDPMEQGVPMDDQLPLGDFDPGRWGWMLADPQPCDPIPVTGRQGVFVLPDGVSP